MTKCSECGYDNADSAVMCLNCGSDLTNQKLSVALDDISEEATIMIQPSSATQKPEDQQRIPTPVADEEEEFEFEDTGEERTIMMTSPPPMPKKESHQPAPPSKLPEAKGPEKLDTFNPLLIAIIAVIGFLGLGIVAGIIYLMLT